MLCRGNDEVAHAGGRAICRVADEYRAFFRHGADDAQQGKLVIGKYLMHRTQMQGRWYFDGGFLLCGSILFLVHLLA